MGVAWRTPPTQLASATSRPWRIARLTSTANQFFINPDRRSCDMLNEYQRDETATRCGTNGHPSRFSTSPDLASGFPTRCTEPTRLATVDLARPAQSSSSHFHMHSSHVLCVTLSICVHISICHRIQHTVPMIHRVFLERSDAKSPAYYVGSYS